MSLTVMVKIVSAALKAKAWTFEAKAKVIKLASRSLEPKAWPRGLHYWLHLARLSAYVLYCGWRNAIFTKQSLMLELICTYR